MAATYPGGSNTYIPSHEASGAMVVDYSRNPSKFALAKYAQIVPTEKQVGLYLEMTVEEAGRVLDEDDRDSDWPDGAPAPEGNHALEAFEWKPFLTRRKAYPYHIGDLASGQASWDIIAQHGRIYAQQAMTRRTVRTLKVATTAGNWGTHTSAVSSISGVTGKWNVSTTARTDIKRSIDYGLEQIMLDTLSAVDIEDIMLVLSPGCARKMAASQEIVDYVKGSPHAKDYITGKLGPNARFGLPSHYAGVELVIEDAAKVTSKKGATKATSFCLADATPFLCSRPGGIEGVEGAPSFSTLTLFAHEEMTVETKHDPDNRRTNGRVVDDVGPVLTAYPTGFLFTAAVD